MENILSSLYDFYVIPIIEDDELLSNISDRLQDLNDSQKRLYMQTQRLYGCKAFQLGLRTGACLERFLNRDTEVPSRRDEDII